MQTDLGFRSVVPTLCLHPVPDDSAMCSVTCKKWYLLNPPGKELGICFLHDQSCSLRRLQSRFLWLRVTEQSRRLKWRRTCASRSDGRSQVCYRTPCICFVVEFSMFQEFEPLIWHLLCRLRLDEDQNNSETIDPGDFELDLFIDGLYVTCVIQRVSGEPINPSLTVTHQQEEMRGFEERGVYHHVPPRVAEADQEGKFIGARLVDVNKGTKKVPKVRSRLVGQACGHGARRCSDSTIGCSPILAVHMHESRKTRLRRPPHTHAGHNNAFLHGKVSRNVCIELSSEDPLSEWAHGGQTRQGHVWDESRRSWRRRWLRWASD